MGYLYYYDLKNIPKAIQYFTRSIQFNPYNSNYLVYLAKSYRKMGSFQETEKYFKQALDIDPSAHSALGGLAKIFF